MEFRKLTVALSLLVLSGCATNNHLYQWGNYEETLFTYFHEPEVKEEMLGYYFEFVNEAQGKKKPLAPGLFAEAGTFMLERGDVTAALRFYELEYATWPESRILMGTLITNIKARQTQVVGGAE
ncbi:DUF4810 domain-containing protein [Pseudidiomarina insulisalsae]|nr:DUF4810 domain-containing protein [Pseudidiomarina insulisalsae]